MSKSENDGRMMCVKCQNDDLSKMVTDGTEGNNSLDPILGGNGRWACIYHGELTELQMFFVPFADEAARAVYFNHEDRVLKKLGMGEYAGQGNSVSSQNEVLSRMKELKLEYSSNIGQEVKSTISLNILIYLVILLLSTFVFSNYIGKEWTFETKHDFLLKFECGMTKEDASDIAKNHNLEFKINPKDNSLIVLKGIDYVGVFFDTKGKLSDLFIPEWKFSFLGIIAGSPTTGAILKNCKSGLSLN